jgi:iron complex outermembrane receptor protein
MIALIRTFLLGVLATALAVGEAYAQSAPAQAQPSATPANQLGEVVVTATRSAQNVQTVPEVVQVVSPAALQSNNVQSVEDLTSLVPGLETLGGMNFSQITIRGQGSGTLSGTAAVNVYFNDVPVPITNLGTNAAGDGLQYDMQSVQVLKGPQGTLFGQNSVGGAILLTTIRPTDQFGGYVTADYGNYNDRQVDAALNVPFGEIGGIRFAGEVHQRDGYVNMLPSSAPGAGYPNGIDEQDVDYSSWRVSFDLRPTDRLLNQFTFHFLNGDGNGEAREVWQIYPGGAALYIFPQLVSLAAEQEALGPRTSLPTSARPNAVKRFRYLTNLTQYNITDDVKFVNIIGYMKMIADESDDNDGTILPILDNQTFVTSYQNQFTWEPRFQGSAFNKTLDWQTGYFYMDQPFQSPAGAYQADTFGAVTDVYQKYNTKSSAVYGQATYDLSAFLKGLKFTAGVRHTTFDRGNYTRTIDLTGACATALPMQQPDCSQTLFGQDVATTYNVSLSYQFSRDGQVYFTTRRGFRGGGFNGSISIASEESFGPEFVTDYEVGLKNIWNVGYGALETNLATFYQDYTSVQISQSVIDPVTKQLVGVTSNVGAARVTGEEAEIIYHPTSRVELGANLAGLDFVFTKFPLDQEATLRATQTLDRPRFAYSLNARYAFYDGDSGEVSMSGNWHWQTETGDYSSPTLAQTGSYPAFGTANASLEWQDVLGKPFDVSIVGTNIFNKLYPMTNIPIPALGFRIESWGEPRMILGRVTYRFGGDAH